MLTKLKTSGGLASLAAGSYYFNFFFELGDGSGVYLSASYSRADLIFATGVLWFTTASIFYFALNAIGAIKPDRMCRAARALFAALIFAVFLRCYLKLAGFAVSYDVLTVDGMMQGLPYPQWLLLLPSLLAWPLFFDKPIWAIAALRFFAVAGFVVVPIGVMRMWETPLGSSGSTIADRYPANVAVRHSGKNAPVARRVVWVVFDEFDPEVAFNVAGQGSPALPELSRLRTLSLNMTQAASPAGSTDISLPAMLMGTAAHGISYGGPGEAFLTTPDGRRVPFDTNNTVFGRLPGGPSTGSVLGFYHPYCQVIAMGRCDSFGTNMGTRWFDGLANLVPKRLSRILDSMTEITINQLDLLPTYLADESQALVFVHLNVPHLPAHFAEKYFAEKARNRDEAYQLNLRLVDLIVGRIVSQLDRAAPSEDQLLILNSDHWNRARGVRTPHPALLLIKVRNDREHLVLEAPVSTYHLGNLVTEYLNGRLNSHNDIKIWYSRQPFAPTWIPNAR